MIIKALLLAGMLLPRQFAAGPAVEDPATRGTLAAPALGYAFDPSAGGVRQIHGVPGASLLDSASDPGVKLSAAAAIPEQDSFLGIAAEDASPVVLFAAQGTFLQRSVANATPGADRIALSPSGTAAVLFSSSAGWIEVITGLPQAPEVSRHIDTSALPLSPGILAVSDDGQFVLAASGDGSGSVWLGPDGLPREVPLPAASAFAFRARSHDALFVTPDGDQSWLASDVGGQTTYRALPGYESLDKAVAVEFSNDGRRFFVATTRGTVARFDFQGGAPEVVSCSCVPAGLYRLRGDSVFLLNDAAASPLFLLDGGGSTPRVFFVPPDGGDQ